ncbi:hypothetical protein E2562_031654 [Oryza meyeriana var. granulata]|uniref:Cytochrome P450 n=1 Tax=Oryza meyeriana var. granulata TaxID=110450 RepID=A0A6G1E554_9ORYZ|nr:hypothetical protein E2562_031654 [Oryza meyeriana var. granulata]
MGIGIGNGAAQLPCEASPWSLLGGAAVGLLLVWAAQMLEWAWLAPRRMDRALRAQGLMGTEYRFLHGDLNENLRLVTAALSKPVPMDRPHDIIPRIAPLLHRASEEHGRMLPAFSASCSELIGRWEHAVAASVGKAKLDVWPEFQNLSGDVISRAAFGVGHQEGRRIFLLQAEQAERLVQSFRTNYIPGFSLLPTENNRRMKAIDREIKTILRGIIEKRQEAMKNGEANKDNLLGLLLESNMDYDDADGGSSKGMTVEEIIEECKLFYFAGMETTAVLLTWTMVALSMHPEWQDRAREEVLQVFGRNKPDFNGVSRLKVVTMVLNEVLRMYPPVVQMNRRTYKEIELGGVTYPPGVMLALPVLFIHRDAAVWGHDAGEFNPGRFAKGVAKACKDPGAFFPFSRGPRICIGQNFALLEAKVALSMILQRFAFELSPAYVHAPYTVLTLHPQHGVPVRLRRL